MTTSTLRPNGTLTGWGSATIVPSGTVHGVTSDDSDSTYVVGGGWLAGVYGKLDLTTVSLPAGSVTKTLTARARWKAASGTATGRAMIVLGSKEQALVDATVGTSATTSTGSVLSAALTQADVDSLQVWVNAQTASGTNLHVIELYVDLVYATQPTVTVTSPTGTIADSTPTIIWDYAQGSDGGPQSRYQVKVFDAATYGGGGFSADTSIPLIDSGEVSSSLAQFSTNVNPLPDGTNHRAYVRAAQTINGTAHWSAWAFSTFTLAATAPAITSVTATASNSSGSIAVTVNRNTGGVAWTNVEVQRSVDAGTSWQFVRGATQETATNPYATFAADTFTVTDYEEPNGTSVLYRARAQSSTGGWSVWTQTAYQVAWSSTDVWLRSVEDPAANVKVSIIERPSTTRTRRQGVFQVVGRAQPVIVTDVLNGRTGTITFITFTADEATDLEALLTEDVHLLQFPAGWWSGAGFNFMWIVTGDVSSRYLSDWAGDVTQLWEIPFTQVSRPADAFSNATA